jgi:hypothetical protein
MNPQTGARLMLHSHHKAHRLQADNERLADVLSLIVTLAESGTTPAHGGNLLAQIAKVGRAGLAGATPPAASLQSGTS